MPKISKRQKTLHEIDQLLFLLIVFYAEENEEQIQELMELKAHILSFRFFEPYESIPKSLQHRTTLLTLPSSEFRQAFRMNKDTFLFVLNRIQNHQVFQNNSYNKQQPVWIQLLVALERFGFKQTKRINVLTISKQFIKVFVERTNFFKLFNIFFFLRLFLGFFKLLKNPVILILHFLCSGTRFMFLVHKLGKFFVSIFLLKFLTRNNGRVETSSTSNK